MWRKTFLPIGRAAVMGATANGNGSGILDDEMRYAYTPVDEAEGGCGQECGPICQ